ncbi:hypothetical protein NEUTE2DRAFT_142654 [Neurospora tetrasperma FGSC 2509]|nr:hypothetical protein NEUTE2DRAFT_142654 [Neurospora tetrasperma FGSC 2509]
MQSCEKMNDENLQRFQMMCTQPGPQWIAVGVVKLGGDGSLGQLQTQGYVWVMYGWIRMMDGTVNGDVSKLVTRRSTNKANRD